MQDDRLIFDDLIYAPTEYDKEKDFERAVVKHAAQIFGKSALYLDIKKRIGNDRVLTIPDGYVLDFTLSSDPRLYIVENELATHDAFRHIGQQLLKFAVSYKASGRKIKEFLLQEIHAQQESQEFVERGLKRAGYRNIDAFLEDLIFDKPVAAVVIIDRVTPELENVLSQLSMRTDVLDFSTYQSGAKVIHRFTPFQHDLTESIESGGQSIEPDEYDTVVVAAHREGFERIFLGENCWYKIRMSSAVIQQIDYIAAYQTAPISAVTHYAPVKQIEKYRDTGKYIVRFSESAKKTGPVKLGSNSNLAVQGPRYTTFERLRNAKTLTDLFA